MFCTGAIFVTKGSCLVARIVLFHTAGRILEQYPSKDIALDLSIEIHINGIIIVCFKSYLNQCF